MKHLTVLLLLVAIAGASHLPNGLAIKCHSVFVFSSPTTDAWTDCTKFEVIADETFGNIASLSADSTTLTILKDGLYQFGGCVHYINGSGGGVDALVASRLLVDGTDEARCSQRAHEVTTPAGGEDVISYNGTVRLTVGQTLTLQYYTDNATISFTSNAVFDNQIAWTLWLARLGD